MSRKQKYFEDDGEDWRQIKPYPVEFMDASRFKIGQKVIVFDTSHYQKGGKCTEAEITRVRNGYGLFPPRRSEYGWDNQHAGWIVVKLPFQICKSMNHDTGKYEPGFEIALQLDEENETWKLK